MSVAGCSTAGKYSNLTVHHRPHPTDTARRPAPMTGIDLRATRSHRGGHWFDPSIAHICKASSEAYQTDLILLEGWGLRRFGRNLGDQFREGPLVARSLA